VGWGTNPRGCFLSGMGGKSLIVSQGRKMGIFVLSRIIYLMVWDGVVGNMGWVYSFLSPFFFHNMVI